MSKFEDEADRLIVVIDDLIDAAADGGRPLEKFTGPLHHEGGSRSSFVVFIMATSSTALDRERVEQVRSWLQGRESDRAHKDLWAVPILKSSESAADHLLCGSVGSLWGSPVSSSPVVDAIRAICSGFDDEVLPEKGGRRMVVEMKGLGGTGIEMVDRLTAPVVHAVDAVPNYAVTERFTVRPWEGSNRTRMVFGGGSDGRGDSNRRGGWLPDTRGDDASDEAAVQSGELTPAETEIDPVKRDLRRARAQRLLGEIDARRAIWNASKQGLSQRQIADQLDRSQTDIGRTLKKVERNPDLLDVRPYELALRRAVGQMSTEELMARLATFPYTAGQVDPSSVGGGYLPGTWDDVRALRREELITSAEWEELFEKRFGRTETRGALLLPDDGDASQDEPTDPEETS